MVDLRRFVSDGEGGGGGKKSKLFRPLRFKVSVLHMSLILFS